MKDLVGKFKYIEIDAAQAEALSRAKGTHTPAHTRGETAHTSEPEMGGAVPER